MNVGYLLVCSSDNSPFFLSFTRIIRITLQGMWKYYQASGGYSIVINVYYMYVYMQHCQD